MNVKAEMAESPRTVLICSCEDTMPLDAGTVERGCRGAKVVAGRQLCRAELEKFRAIADRDTPLTVGCTQEAPLFAELAENRETSIQFVNIRETAGWSSDAARAAPKMAALLAAAAEPAPDIPFVSYTSEGVALIYGRDERAIEAGSLLKDHLNVTVLIKPPADLMPPRTTDFPVVKGAIRLAQGYLGAFELTDRQLRAAGAVFARRADVRRRRRTTRCRAAISCSISRAMRRCSAPPICARATCAPIPPMPPRRCARCSRRATSPARSTSRATSISPRTSARIPARRSSAATAASISVRPARLRPPAITWRSTHISAPVAGNAQPSARPAPHPTRCRRPTLS